MSGRHDYGRLGLGRPPPEVHVPATTVNGVDAAAAAASVASVVPNPNANALEPSAQPGEAAPAVLVHHPSDALKLTPIGFFASKGVKAIGAGMICSFAIDEDGHAYSWGSFAFLFFFISDFFDADTSFYFYCVLSQHQPREFLLQASRALFSSLVQTLTMLMGPLATTVGYQDACVDKNSNNGVLVCYVRKHLDVELTWKLHLRILFYFILLQRSPPNRQRWAAHDPSGETDCS